MLKIDMKNRHSTILEQLYSPFVHKQKKEKYIVRKILDYMTMVFIIFSNQLLILIN